MKPKNLASLISAYFTLGVGPALQALSGTLQINGNSVEPGSLISVSNQLIAAAAAADQYPFNTSAAASITLTNLQNLTQRLTNGGAVVVTLDSAWNIVNAVNNPFVGQSFPFYIAATGATTVAAPTLTGSGVTLSGTTTVLAAAMRAYQAQITQVTTTSGATVTAGTTFTSIAQVGSTNRYTVTLSGNSVSPTVGQAIYLNVTAGTLPAGWYPIDQVTNANSFVVVLPPSSAAWTATAGTVPGTALVPASQYTPTGMPGVTLPGIYSPLVTVTGMWATATAVITV